MSTQTGLHADRTAMCSKTENIEFILCTLVRCIPIMLHEYLQRSKDSNSSTPQGARTNGYRAIAIVMSADGRLDMFRSEDEGIVLLNLGSRCGVCGSLPYEALLRSSSCDHHLS